MLEFFVAFVIIGMVLVFITALALTIAIGSFISYELSNKELWRQLYKKWIEKKGGMNDEMYNSRMRWKYSYIKGFSFS
jgi:hypothetical protein